MNGAEKAMATSWAGMPTDSIHHSRFSHSAGGNKAATGTANSITVKPAMPTAAMESDQRRRSPARANRQTASAPTSRR